MIRYLVGAALLVSVTFGQGPADAADAAAPLRAEQAQLFEKMRRQPSDLDLMFSYAAVSMRLEDYEAAISTLERMLIYDPNLPRVRLELGVAYYRLGVYDVSKFYFEGALKANPPPEVVARIEPFLKQIAQRTAKNSFGLLAGVGGVYSTNAALGPSDTLIRSDLFPGGVAFLDRSSIARADAGTRLRLSGSYDRDLGLPNEDSWLSTFDYSGLRFFDVTRGDLDSIRVTTGPTLALTPKTYGPKVRPFASFELLRSADAPLYLSGGGGLQFTDAVSERLGLQAIADVSWRDFDRRDQGYTGLYSTVVGGATYSVLADTLMSGALILETDRTDKGYDSSNLVGLRAGVVQSFEVPAFRDTGFFEQPWRASLSGQVTWRFFDDGDPAVLADTPRRDQDARVAMNLTAPVTPAWSVALDLSYYARFSNIRNYDLSDFEAGVTVSWAY